MNNFGDKNTNSKYQIPAINRDGPLLTRLLPIVIGGFDWVLDEKAKLFFRLLCRLVDKSFDEYSVAKTYVDQEMQNKDKLAHRFSIINHFENCINAINRAAKTFESLMKDKNKLLQYVSKASLENIKKYKISAIRNRVEHIDQDIQEGKFRGQLFLDVDNNYEKICINGRCVMFVDLASMIDSYHKALLEICNKLPNKY